MTLSRLLAELAVDTQPEAISASAYAAAKKMVLDTLATTLAGWREPGVPGVVELVRDWGGRPQARLVAYGDGVPLPNAAFANSVMAHALDYDDVYIPASLHIMSVVMPVCLGAAEMTRTDGRAFLASVVLGVETACRLGLTCASRRRGAAFLPTSVEGGFGATAAACRLLGQTVDQTTHALGVNGAQASGIRQALYDMTLTKRLQPALAARSAVWAAQLAQHGLTGPHRVIEGEAGLFAAYHNGDAPDADELMAARDFWEIERDSIKRFCSCGAAHPLTEGALALACEHDLRSEDIDHVLISWAGRGNPMTGNAFEMGANPQVNAQFSAPYCVALALVRRTGAVDRMTDDAIRADPQTAELARRVRCVAELDPPARRVTPPPGLPTYYGAAHVVIVVLKDGRTFRRDVIPGEHFDPEAVTWADVVTKFHECAAFSGVCPENNARRVVELVDALDKQESLDELLGLLCPAS